MLRFLRIRNLAVIEAVEVEFEPGFNVLTGETGAGKSILVEAVGLLLGARASADLVRTGEAQATIEAIFEERDDRELIVRREISSQGRSRSFINGALATAAALRDLAARLVELHGQHEHQTLLDPLTHLTVLDTHAALDRQVQSVTDAFTALQAVSEALETSRRAFADREARRELLGFQASVLRQIEFRSISIPFWSDSRLDLYLKAWAKVIFANDPRAWGSTVARARVEAGAPITEEVITHVLHDVYIPGARLANPDLRRWFSETDAWWMDNLRRNIDGLEDQLARAQAITLGLQTGDYALSFDDETRELRRPLTTVFWRLAGRAIAGPANQPSNRSFCLPVEEFIRQARADVLFLSLPSGHSDRGGAEARGDWRESWVNGAAAEKNQVATSQSKQSHLNSIERLLRLASNFRAWAIEYQEPGLASAQDILELIKEYRTVRATYSKDVTEVAGGLRSYIIVGEKSAR